MLNEIVTARGTPNIALVKYWGVRDEALTLPINSSASMTLSASRNGDFATTTSVVFSRKFARDKIFIDGQERKITDKRVNFVLDKLRQISGIRAKALIVSKNRFPSDAGIASSASGIATLAFACAKALDLNISTRELSMIARLGSGSAARSLWGGFVVWHRGTRNDGRDSYAEQIKPHSHWPDMIDMVALTTHSKKYISTFDARKRSEETSKLYKMRAEIAERNVRDVVAAIRKKDFESLADIAMRDSNNMHAIMLDSVPPVMYLNDVGKEVIKRIHEMNETEGRRIAGYTFDAGHTAHILTTRKNERKMRRLLGDVEGIININTLGIGKTGPLLSRDQLINKKML